MRNTTILHKYVVHANALTYFTFAVTYLFKMDLVTIYNSQFHFLNLYLETKIIVKDS
jgi:hypothetical protein